MNRTSTLSLLLGLTGVALAGCSSPDEGGGIPPAPTVAPDFASNPSGQAGTGQTVNEPLNPAGGAGGQAGTTNDVVPGAMAGSAGMGGSAMGAAGTTGMTGTEIPIGTGTVIAPAADGWVAAGTNQFGIQGSFYSFADSDNGGGGATTMSELDFTGGSVCVSGVASQVVPLAGSMEPAYSTYWGGGIGLNLADPGNDMALQPWNRGNVVGFSFTISGATVPPPDQFRFKATFYEGAVVNENYCVGGVAAGANSIQLSSIVNECYIGGLNAPPLSPTAELAAIQWQIATVTDASTPFDFCIENLTPITQ